jgi:3-oxoacyl-[acyl-carrier protein] reductase
MQRSLNKKIAFVTGGSRGIGAAIVRKLARQGAVVALTFAGSHDKASALVAEIHAAGGRALAIQADSGDPAALQAAIAQVASEFGRIDILVNSAGLLLRGEVEEFALEDFNRMFEVNVRAAFVAVQAALPHMTAGSAIVLVGSVVAERAGLPGSAVYAMTKGALASLTRGLARDLGPRGITVSNVQPGPTVTDMSRGGEPEMAALLTPMMPIGRLGQPEEIADFVAFLVSEEGRLITGASLTIDGGFLA